MSESDMRSFVEQESAANYRKIEAETAVNLMRSNIQKTEGDVARQREVVKRVVDVQLPRTRERHRESLDNLKRHAEHKLYYLKSLEDDVCKLRANPDCEVDEVEEIEALLTDVRNKIRVAEEALKTE